MKSWFKQWGEWVYRGALLFSVLFVGYMNSRYVTKKEWNEQVQYTRDKLDHLTESMTKFATIQSERGPRLVELESRVLHLERRP